MPNVVATNVIKAHIEHLETLQAEADTVADNIKAAFAAAKAAGLDLVTLKTALRVRRQDAGAKAEQDALLSLYLSAGKAAA